MAQRLLNAEVNKRVTIKPNKTISRKDDGYKGVMYFGENNDYPEVMEKLTNSSVTAKAAVKAYARFLAGHGFENEAINDIVVGNDEKGKKITLRQMLREAAMSVASNKGVYIHCNLTPTHEVKNTHIKPFKYCRFSIPDDTGYSAKILFYDNWTKDRDRVKRYSKSDIVAFNVFNLDPTVRESQIKAAGGIKQDKGQVYHEFFDKEYFYPLHTMDPVYLDCDNEDQISLYRNRQLRNGFLKKIVMRLALAGTEQEKQEQRNEILEALGVDGDPVVMINDDMNPDTGEIDENSAFRTETLDSGVDDQLFKDWPKEIANQIRKAAENLPAVLIDYELGQLSSQSGEALAQAVAFYNLMVSDDVELMEKVFQEIYSNHKNETLKNNTNWKIKRFSIKNINNGVTNTNTTATV